jgi:hypothetical protein
MFGPQKPAEVVCICPPAGTAGAAAAGGTCGPAAAKVAATQPAPRVASAEAAPARAVPAQAVPAQAAPAPKPAAALAQASAATAPAPAPAEETTGAPGRVYFFRTAPFGTALQPLVQLNGVTVGKAVPRQYFVVERPPGRYKATTTLKNTRDLDFILPPGGSAYIEVNVTPGVLSGQAVLLLADEQEGKSEISRRSLGAQ